MNRSTIALIALAVIASIAMTIVPAMADTWDLTSSWNSATPGQMGQFTASDVGQPPGGGYQFNTVGSVESAMPGGLYWYVNDAYFYGQIYKNTLNVPTSQYGDFEFNPGEIGLVSGGRGYGWLEQTIKFSWIAPQDMSVVVTGSLAGISHSSYYANNMHAVQFQVAHGADSLVRDYVIGYRGDAVRAAFGDKPTATFATGPVSVLAGQTIDYFVWQWDDNNTYNGHAFTGITFTVATAPPTGITGTVTSSHGGPIVGAVVSVDGQPSKTALTLANGSYALNIGAGTYALTATKDGFAVGHLTGVVVSAGQMTNGQDIVLHPSITGTVRTNAGGVVAGALVSVDGQPGKTATSQADGTYAIGIGAGTYALTVTKAGYGDGHRTGVVVVDSAETSGQDLSLAYYGIAGTLSCAFNGGVTKPVAGATVIAWNSSSSSNATTNANGYYEIAPATGTYTLEVSAAGYSGGTVNGVSFTAGSPTVQNLSVTHDELPWDFTQDFSSSCNPNNQWSYGWLAAQANDFRLYDLAVPGYPSRFPTTIPEWSAAGQQDFKGGIGRFDDQVGLGDPYYPNWPDATNPHAPFPYVWYERGMGWMFNRGGGEACIRWTSPDARIIKLTIRVTAQCRDQGIDDQHWNEVHSYGQFKIKKNGVDMYVDHVQGFIGSAGFAGTSDNNYTDSIGSIAPIGPKPEMNFETVLPVNAGDTIDLAQWYKYAWPYPLFGVWETVDKGTGDIVTTIPQMKSKADGTTVFLTTPMALVCDTDNFSDPTNTAGSIFYIESDDRSQTMKLINDGTVPKVTNDYKIEFTGTVDTIAGQKVVRVKSINNTVPLAAKVKPLGTTCKAIAAAPLGTGNNKLVKVWGKVTSLVLNTDPKSNGSFKWEYALITDGSQTVKIPMHNTSYWMNEADNLVGLLEGHYIAVTGVAVQSGTDTLVCPRSGYDFYNYTLNLR